jgi:hypothetical protein
MATEKYRKASARRQDLSSSPFPVQQNVDNQTKVDTRSIHPQILLLLSEGYVDPIGP